MLGRQAVWCGGVALPIALALLAGRGSPPASAVTARAGSALSQLAATGAPPGAPRSPALLPPPVLTADSIPGELTYGARAAISGRLLVDGQPGAGETVELQVAPWPYRQWSDAAHTVTAADGSYSFVRLRPDRNSRYRVQTIETRNATSPTVSVWVDPSARVTSHSLGPGRVRLTLVIHHARDFSSRGSMVWWFVAPRRSRHFVLAARTRALTPSVGVTFASAIVNPPARRFVFRVCLSPSWQREVGRPRSRRRCPIRDFTLGRSAR